MFRSVFETVNKVPIPQTAFAKWMRENTDGDVELCASYLTSMCMTAPEDSIVWDLLRETGDTEYRRETFIKAAKILLEVV